ncbi:MAG: ABC transporter permease [Chitinophagaceae bacterium]|nr:ABC transporter permease [Chitinophagaceae bacterium]
MKQFLTFVQKEFYHVLRDKKTLLILFGMPVVQILIFGFALSNEVKNSKIVVMDQAKDISSQKLINKIEASKYFDIEESIHSQGQIDAAFKKGAIKMALIIPAGFYQNLVHEHKAQVQVIADASDPNIATALTNYANAIVQDFQTELNTGFEMPYTIIPETRMLYNPQQKSVYSMVPGVMALVLMLLCVLMTAISIVREKETGTMEVLLVSPFKPSLVILSKTVPYLLLSFIDIIIILMMSVWLLGLPINGNIFLLLAVSVLYIITCLSLGILISIKTTTQQAAMMISLMGMLLPSLMLSGFMFPIENMPVPLQVISNIVPATWFNNIIKAVMIKGLGPSFIWKEVLILTGMTLFFLFVSLKSFKIRLA